MASRLAFFEKYFIRPFLGLTIKREMLSFFPTAQGRVLDLGCNRGEVSKMLKKMGFDRVVGLEISRSDIVEAGKLKGLSFVQGDAQQAPFKKESFDAIFCSEVIEHVDKDGQLMKEAARMLKPGGFLLITTPDYSTHEAMSLYFPSRKFYLDKLLHKKLGYTEIELESLGRRCGLSVEKVGYTFPTCLHTKANVILNKLSYPLNYVFGAAMWMLFALLSFFQIKKARKGISIKVLFQKP